MTTTRIEPIARAVTAALVFACVVAVPLLHNPHTVRGFEEDKVLLLRMLALPLVPALVLVPGAFARLGVAGIGALLYLAASGLAALVSSVPAYALTGGYSRQAGLLTDVALVALFFGARTIAHRGTGRRGELLVDLILGSAAATSVRAIALPLLPSAVVERYSLAWVFLDNRAASLAGGPTFLGSLLCVAIPLAAARFRSRTAIVLCALYGAALLLSASRIPLLVAVLGLCAVVMMTATFARKWLLRGAIAAVVLLGVFSVGPVRDRLPADALPNRIASVLQGDEIGARLMIWREALSATTGDARKLVAGYGPDSIGTRFTSHVSPELQRQLGGATRIDRFHSDVLDLLFTRGLFALLGLALLGIGSVVVTLRPRRSGGVGDSLAAGVAIAVVATLIDGSLAVPGPISRTILFVLAGWLAGRASTVDSGGDGEPVGATTRSFVCGLALVLCMFGCNGFIGLLVGAPFLWLLRGAGLRGVGVAAAVALPFALFGWLLRTGFALDETVVASRGRLETGVLMAVCLLVAGLLARSLWAAGPERTRAPAVVPTRAALAALLLAAAGVGMWRDAKTEIADVNARAAIDCLRSGGSPELAVNLFNRSVRLAPDVPDYRRRSVAATAALISTAPSREPPADLLNAAHVNLAEALNTLPRDAANASLCASAALDLSRVLPRPHDFALRRFAHRAAMLAATEAPHLPTALEIAAETSIERGRFNTAAELLDHALDIDASRARTHLLRARAAAGLADVPGAAVHYAQSDRRRRSPEALAGLACAAILANNYSGAATLLSRLARHEQRTGDLDVAGMRPLTKFVDPRARKQAFALARSRGTNPESLDRVERAIFQ